VTKPVKQSDLLDAIVTAVGKSGGMHTEEPEVRRPRRPSGRSVCWRRKTMR
jgi:hypothetical protein